LGDGDGKRQVGGLHGETEAQAAGTGDEAIEAVLRLGHVAAVGEGLQDAIDAGLGDVSALVDIFEGNGPVALFKQLDDVERLGKDGNEIEPLDL
jgi:hypothetical protein